MESIRDSLAEELVKLTEQVTIIHHLISFLIFQLQKYVLKNLSCQCEKLKVEAATLPGVKAELDALRQRHNAALELMGERDEEVHFFFMSGFSFSLGSPINSDSFICCQLHETKLHD